MIDSNGTLVGCHVITENDFGSLYGNIINKLLHHSDCSSTPRGIPILELVNVSCCLLDPTKILFTNSARNLDKRYLARELKWYFSKSNKLSDIEYASSFWKNIANKDGTLNSAYGYLLWQEDLSLVKQTGDVVKNQWDWAFYSLFNDQDTRQAIMHFNSAQHQFIENKDFVCTLTGQFLIRKNKLNLIINMRSSDVFFGVTYDYPFFALLIQKMRKDLLFRYPDLELGSLIVNSGSLHLYERNIETVKKMNVNEFKSESLLIDNLYNWIGENI